MVNEYCRVPQWEATRTLAAVAQGLEKAELVVRDAKLVNVTRGPSVTRYELELDQGVRLNKLTNLADDIALSLGATGVRIAPIPDQISKSEAKRS